MTTTRPSGAIIAGGRARRFGGRDKGQLLVDGRPIIVRQVELLQRVADEVVVIGEHPGRTALTGVPVFPDLRPGLGPIGGLHTALTVTSREWVLVTPCDMPFLEAELFERLAALAATADAAWVRTAAGAEPLVACYARRVEPRVRQAIDAGHLKLTDLARSIAVRELSGNELAQFGDPARLLTNVNTPDDYERIQ